MDILAAEFCQELLPVVAEVYEDEKVRILGEVSSEERKNGSQ